jgi:hypothetical protein
MTDFSIGSTYHGFILKRKEHVADKWRCHHEKIH